jgi:glucose-6-phosphate isomerase
MNIGDIPFQLLFNIDSGQCPERESTKRYLPEVESIFHAAGQAAKILSTANPLVYEFYELPMPDDSGDLAFGTSITSPGMVGDEYFMTKGHFHSILSTEEF